MRYAYGKPSSPDTPAPHRLQPTLAELYNSWFQAGAVPDAANVSLVTPIYKRGDAAEPSNYRPTAVGEPVTRLYAALLNVRLVAYTERAGLRAPSQAGFRPRLSTQHQLFCLQHLVDRATHLRQPLFCCFLDLKGAYDRVPRALLWQALQRLGVHGRMLGALQSLYSNAEYAINVGDRRGVGVRSTRGVKQGCPLSPTLFGLLLDGLHWALLAGAPGAGPQLACGRSVPDLGYADDFCLLATSPAHLQRLLDVAHGFLTSVGMELSVNKTCVMAFGVAAAAAAEGVAWSCGGVRLEREEQYKYLGVTFSAAAGIAAAFPALRGRLYASWERLRRHFGTLHDGLSRHALPAATVLQAREQRAGRFVALAKDVACEAATSVLQDTLGELESSEAASLSGQTHERDDEHAPHHGFNWLKQWYPLAVVADLDPARPHGVQLLGRRLVLWRSGDGVWRATEDCCPHRLAPLSEGRIEPSDGTLMCSYHGWRFAGDGTCVGIPQAADARAEAAALASPRSCAVTYPTQVRKDGLLWVWVEGGLEAILQQIWWPDAVQNNGLLWVWAEGGPAAAAEAAATPAVAPEELDDPGQSLYLSPWFMRDVPYGADTLVENVLDPSHVPFSHHGTIGGSDRSNPSLYKMAPVDYDPVNGFQVSSEAVSGRAARVRGRSHNALLWQPPTLARYRFGDRGLQMITHCVPTAPGRARLFFAMVTPAATASPLVRRLLPLLPRWAGHFGQHAVLDGDNVFLHVQDCELRRLGGQWQRHYYLPTSMDAAVTAARRWFSGAPVPWPPGAEAAAASAPALSRRELLDRFDSHTVHCASCSRAFKASTTAQWAAAALACACLLAASALFGAGRRLPAPDLALALVGAALSVAGAFAARWLVQRFVFVDYVHAEHN
ncbi:hypothetical protein WJX81_004916 [Elliptochloris bilobata]|uniref:Pheophorbide a oxygenase n=1 Tax=Elliptochloris bilobata TaxID=381761 RepID=A0AAW1SDJ4_9CHLO